MEYIYPRETGNLIIKDPDTIATWTWIKGLLKDAAEKPSPLTSDMSISVFKGFQTSMQTALDKTELLWFHLMEEETEEPYLLVFLFPCSPDVEIEDILFDEEKQVPYLAINTDEPTQEEEVK